MNTDELNRAEKSCLMYLETCAVDYCGQVQSVRMNQDDFDAIKNKLKPEGYIDFGRNKLEDINKQHATQYPRTHWVEFTDKGFKMAAQLRRERAERNWNKRFFNTGKDNARRGAA